MSHLAYDDAGPRRVVAGGRKALTLLTLVSIFAYMDRSALAILVEPIKADLRLSDSQLGLLSGLAFALFYATLGVPLARVADRGSRVKLLSVCLALWSVATALVGVARSFPQLFLARMAVGVGEAGCVPPAHSLISDYFPRRLRPLAIGIFQSGAVVGIAGGLYVVGMLEQRFGWRMSLQITGLAGLPLAILFFFTVREPPRPQGHRYDGAPALAAIGRLLRSKAFVHLLIAYALSGGCINGASVWYPAFLMRSFGLSTGEVGAWLGSLTMISGICGMLSGGYAAGRLVTRDARWELWLPAISYVVCAPLLALMFLAPDPVTAMIASALVTYIASVGAGVSLAAIQSLVDPNNRATAVSVIFFVSSLVGTGGAPYAIGLVSDMLEPALGLQSLRYSLLLAPVVLLWSVLHFLMSARHVARSAATAPPDSYGGPNEAIL